MSARASERALRYLYASAGHDGVTAGEVGQATWPDRERVGVSVNGGGDYAAQMLLGRLKKAGLVEHAPSEGSSLWRLSARGREQVRRLSSSPTAKLARSRRAPAGERAPSAPACTCGHAPEEHGHDPEFPGSTSCAECDCVAYDADPEAA